MRKNRMYGWMAVLAWILLVGSAPAAVVYNETFEATSPDGWGHDASMVINTDNSTGGTSGEFMSMYRTVNSSQNAWKDSSSTWTTPDQNQVTIDADVKASDFIYIGLKALFKGADGVYNKWQVGYFWIGAGDWTHKTFVIDAGQPLYGFTRMVIEINNANGLNPSATFCIDNLQVSTGTASVASPVFAPVSGTIAVGQPVTITCATAGAEIWYTTDNSTPTQGSPSIRYYAGDNITVGRGTTTLTAKAWATGYNPSAVVSATYTLVPASVSIAATDDTYLSYYYPTSTGYGALGAMMVGGSVEKCRMLLGFDLSSLPSNATILSANLRVSARGSLVNNSTPMTVSVYRMTHGWVGNDANWNTYDGTNVWSVPGAGSDHLATATTSLTSAFQGSDAGRGDFTFTNLATDVQAWVTIPSLNNGWILTGEEASGNPKIFYTRETANPPSAYAPMLDITYDTASTSPPVFTPAGGPITLGQPITIACGTPGADIWYTTDNSTPTQGSPSIHYTGPITVSQRTTTLTACAFASGQSPSEVVSATYTVVPASVSIPASADTYLSSYYAGVNRRDQGGFNSMGAGLNSTFEIMRSLVKFDVSSVPPEAAILSANLRLAATSWNAATPSTTISVYRMTHDWLDNATWNTYDWNLTDTWTTPGAGSDHLSVATASLTSSFVGDANTNPRVDFTFTNLTADVQAWTTFPSLNDGVILTGDEGTTNSWKYFWTRDQDPAHAPMLDITYDLATVATPAFSPGSGTIAAGQPITITCGTSGAQIWYTTDNSTPTQGGGTSIHYTVPFTISQPTTLMARAWATGKDPSAIVVATYDLGPVPSPVFHPAAGTIVAGQPITITCDFPTPEIWYTTDNSTPTQGGGTSIRYNLGDNITLSQTTTLTAKAWATGSIPSAVVSATYTICRPANIPNGTVTVDGNLADWAGSVWAPLDQLYDGTGTDIAEGYYSVQWTVNKVYVAVKVRDTSHHLADGYGTWMTQDDVEIYLHTTGVQPGGSTNYSADQYAAQQYTVGIGTDNVSAWSVVGDNQEIPLEAEFQAAGRAVGDWLYYEVAMTPFQVFSLMGSGMVPSPLSVGDVIGVDVVAASYQGGATPLMKAENLLQWKSNDYTKIATHRLTAGGSVVYTEADLARVLAAMDARAGDGNWNVTADLDSDGEVTSSDLAIVLANLP